MPANCTISSATTDDGSRRLPGGMNLRSGSTSGFVTFNTASPNGLRKSARTSGISTRSRNAITTSVNSAVRMKCRACM